MIVCERFTGEDWNDLIAPLPIAHILQTEEWGEVKRLSGWDSFFLIWKEQSNEKPDLIVAAALVLQRSLSPAGFSRFLRVMYVPKGPLLVNWSDERIRNRVLDDLASFAQDSGAIFIKIDPDVPTGTGVPGSSKASDEEVGLRVTGELKKRGWQFSDEQIQFRNTVLIDLNATQEELLANMKQKTRYNIRLAERRGVKTRIGTSSDFDMLVRMYTKTAVRNEFVIREGDYYHEVWEKFYLNIPSAVSKGNFHENQPQGGMVSPFCEPIIAEIDGEPVGAVMIFYFCQKAWYLYGMSRRKYRRNMPNYLLQWEAICRAKEYGCKVYDLWGAPDEFNKEDPLWGVYRFKSGFGGEVTRHIGAWDLPIRPVFYQLYTRVLPVLLKLMRRRGIARMQKD